MTDSWRKIFHGIVMISVLIALARGSLYGKLVEVEVRNGDTLHGFASKYLKDPSEWPAIYKINRNTVKDPNSIFPGQIIFIPIEMLKDEIGDIISLVSNVKVKKREVLDWKTADLKERLFPEDGIMTGADSYAQISFLVGGALNVNQKSMLYLKPSEKKNAVASLLEGTLNVNRAKIITPSAQVLPRGESIYDINVDDKKTTKISVRDGEVDVKAEGKTVTVSRGFRTQVKMNEAPQEPVLLPIDGEEALEYRDSVGANADIRFLVQVSETSGFDTLLKNREVENIDMDWIKKELKPGQYYWRAAIIDGDGFRGEFSSPKAFAVRTYSEAVVKLTRFEILNREERIMKISGSAQKSFKVVVNGYPAQMDEKGDFISTIVLSEDQKTIAVTAVGKEGVVIRKYHRTDDNMWLPVQ